MNRTPFSLRAFIIGAFLSVSDRMKKLAGLFLVGLISLTLTGSAFPAEIFRKPPVKLGIEVLVEKRPDLLKGKKVGLITNRSGTDSLLNSSIDLIHGLPGVRLVALYAPEHGIRGGSDGRGGK